MTKALLHSKQERETGYLPQLRVCFALPRLLPDEKSVIVGGSANTALTLGIAMARCGVRIEILAPVPSDCAASLHGHAASSLVTPLVYPRTGALGMLEGLRSLLLLVRALNQRQTDLNVIHSHSGTFPYALIPMRCSRTPVRIHSLYCPLGGEGGAYSKWWDQRFLARFILQHLDIVAAVSENVQNSLHAAGIQSQKIALLPMCVDTIRFRPQPDRRETEYFTAEGQGYRILFVGNASREKGLLNFVDALGLLADQGLRLNVVATLENANSVDEFEQTYQIAKEKFIFFKMEDRVRFKGLVQDMPRLYAEADIVVIPWVSTRGPSDIPMVALEAMAMGKCVVSTPVGGCSDLLRRGDAGLLTDDFSPESLASTLKRCIESETLRRQVGEAAVRLADDFSADKLAGRMIALYRELLNRKKRKRT